MARYIDVEALKNDGHSCYHDGKGNIYYDVDHAPTADVVEVKHGEWDINVGMNFNKERICPICKKRIESNYWEFCSHCGAKMDGERKGAE